MCVCVVYIYSHCLLGDNGRLQYLSVFFLSFSKCGFCQTLFVKRSEFNSGGESRFTKNDLLFLLLEHKPLNESNEELRKKHSGVYIFILFFPFFIVVFVVVFLKIMQ